MDPPRDKRRTRATLAKVASFHKYSSLAAYLIPALKESCFAMTLLLIQCICSTHSLTLDHSFIPFLLHGFKHL